MKTIALSLFVLCLWALQTAHAEIAYISDNLRVGLRSEPGTSVAPFTVLTTGDKLTSLETQGAYSRIRTEKKEEGWVRSVYLSNTPPAKILIDDIRADYKKAQKELTNVQSLNQKIKSLDKEIFSLNQKITALNPEGNRTWIYMVVAMLLLCVLAFALGIFWDRHRVAKKLGGHTL